MNELPPPPPETNHAGDIIAKIKKDSTIHLIFAAVLAVFVTIGYYPSGEGPKFDPVEHKTAPAAASADTRAAIDKENAEIDKKNTEGRDQAAKALKDWQKSGRENHVALRLLTQFLAGLVSALWVVFFVASYLIKPLLSFLKDFLGEEFAKVITPLFMLGIAYVLSTIVVQNTAVKDLTGSGLVVTLVSFVNHILRPFLSFIIDFTEFVVKNWTVGVAYLLIIVYAIVRKFAKPVE